MQEDRLTQNGIEKLMNNIPGIVIQVLALQEKLKNNQRFFGCDVSDGFCRLKGCLIVDDQVFTHKKTMKENVVIRVMSSTLQFNKQQQPILIIEYFKPVEENTNQIIGRPMVYDEWIKKGKKNPQGSNFIEEGIKKENGEKQNQSKTVKRSQPIQQNKSHDENSKINKGIQPNKDKESNSRANSRDNNHTYQSKLNLVTKEQSNQQSLQKNQNSNRPPPKQSRVGPIQKVEKKDIKRSSPIVKGHQKKANSQYTEIRSLYIGMDNWVLLARVLFVSPLKQIMTKKGTQSTILTIEIGDSSGTIQCTMFGQSAQKIEGTLKEDQVYQFSIGHIGQSSYMGKHSLRINFNEQTKICMKQDDPSIPYSEDFCLSIKKLINQVQVGDEARVICLIKDEGQPIKFTSKAGKEMIKKVIYLCDPQDKVEVEVILWNELADVRFEKFPYMIKGVGVGMFQQNRQYSLKKNYQYRILKQHNLRKYIKDMSSIEFANPNSNNKAKRVSITNFAQLNSCMDEITSNSVWSQVICYINTIRLNSKNYYISCPQCKKKVAEDEDVDCLFCRKHYDKPKYRYILNVNLCDSFDNIWATAYDEAGEKLMTLAGRPMTARQFSQLSDDGIQELLRFIRFKQVKLRMVTKNQEYNNEQRKKTNIIKVLDINYQEQTKNIINKLAELMSQ